MHRRPFVVVTVALGLSLGLVAGCGGGGGSKAKSKSGETGTTVSGGTATPVSVELGDAQGTNGPMTMTVSPASVPAGKVTFTVKNTGTILHEMVVLKTDTPFDQLPVDAHNKVSEASKVGETGDVAKGATKSVTLDLKAGNYVLVCNIAKHYSMGMRAAFTVT
jgi:uncharacterized cupredoxin-like copper-binding protein